MIYKFSHSIHRLHYTRNTIQYFPCVLCLLFCKVKQEDGTLVIQPSMVWQIPNKLDTEESVSAKGQIRNGICDVHYLGIHLVFHRQYESSVMVRCVYGTGGCMGMAFS